MKQYNITRKKVTNVVTDNGSNFQKAFREYGEEGTESSNPELEDELMDTGVEDHDELEFNSVSELDQRQADDFLPRNQPCASHTLSLICVRDIAQVKVRHLKSAFAKCSAILNKMTRSTKTSEQVKAICGKLLSRPCPTRWNSFFDSIVSILEHKEKLQLLCDALAVPYISENELEFLEEYRTCLQPVAVALDRLQGDKNCFYGELIPTLLVFEKKLATIQDTQYCQQLVAAVLSGIRRRFKEYLELDETKSDAIVAAVSHPFFKLRWVPVQKADFAREIFINKMVALNNTSKLNVAANESTSAACKLQEMDNQFFEFPTTAEKSEHPTLEEEIRVQCSQYLADRDDGIQLLHKFPFVKKGFIKFNTTLPSSGPVERMFNYAGMILSPKRRLLSDDLFESVLLLKLNKYVI